LLVPPEIIALIDKPMLLAFVLAVGAACGIGVERISEKMKRAERKAYWEKRNGGKANPPKKDGTATTSAQYPRNATAAEQLRLVMGSDFTARSLLNKPEQRLLAVLDKVLEADSPGWRAHGQVSLGEILWSEDKEAFWAINAKRVDLLIVDSTCKPLHAVEFQGSGHHLSKEAAARDAIKKEALRRAGIGYIEVQTGDTPSDVKAMVQKLVRQSQTA